MKIPTCVSALKMPMCVLALKMPMCVLSLAVDGAARAGPDVKEAAMGGRAVGLQEGGEDRRHLVLNMPR